MLQKVVSELIDAAVPRHSLTSQGFGLVLPPEIKDGASCAPFRP